MKTRKYTPHLPFRILHPVTLVPDVIYEELDCRQSEVDSDGNTGLMIACQEGHLPSVKVAALNDGLDCQDEDGWTALMYASYHNHPEVVSYLATSKANLHLKNNNGKNARLLAYFEGHEEVLSILDTFLTKV
jgi:ankyrin repeat protein